MKVLFVCQYNVGRSQMAEAFYNYYTKNNDADSAGINVNEPGQSLIERKKISTSSHFYVLDVMKNEGIDISNAKRELLNNYMLNKYDQIISMADKSITPKWLLESPKFIYWDVRDPGGKNYEITAKTRDIIKAKVLNLIK